MAGRDDQQTLYETAAAQYGPAIERIARAYEADADERRDLVQDIQAWVASTRLDPGAAAVQPSSA